MKKIARLLNRFLGDAHFGEDAGSIRGAPADPAAQKARARERATAQKRLVNELSLVQSSSDKYFHLCVAMIVVLFLGACALVFMNRDNTSAITALFTATGISLTGLATLMFKFWKGKLFAGAMLVLASNLPPEDLHEVVGVFAGRLADLS